MVQAFASHKNVMKHIAWQDNEKSYAEMVVEYEKVQKQIDLDRKKHGYRYSV
jgi:glyceraldehyde-3-phosphate dehydrogenase/erythrose-4-phosphate dehydrogenase